MFNNRKDQEPSALDDAIERLFIEMNIYDPTSDEYATLLKHLRKLSALKPEEGRKPLSSDAILMVIGNLAGIALMVTYEQKHVITSKALGFIMKIK